METEMEAYEDLRTTKALLTLEVLDLEHDFDDVVSEAEESPEPVRRTSPIDENGGWEWTPNDGNNNPRPISQRPRLRTPPPERQEDLNKIYNFEDLQKCGTCKCHIKGIEIDMNNPVPRNCSTCQAVIDAKEKAKHKMEQNGNRKTDKTTKPRSARSVSKCHCTIC